MVDQVNHKAWSFLLMVMSMTDESSSLPLPSIGREAGLELKCYCLLLKSVGVRGVPYTPSFRIQSIHKINK